MANLLPQHEKKALRKDALQRVALVALLFFVGVLLFANISLFPSFFFSRIQEENITEEIEKLREFVAQEEKEGAIAEVRSTRAQLKILSAEAKPFEVTDVLQKMDEQLFSGIVVEDVLYEVQGDVSVLNMRGRAATRANLLEFTNQLKAEETFSDINLPVANLAESQNVRFDFALRVNDTTKPAEDIELETQPEDEETDIPT